MITVERIDASGTAHRITIREHELLTDFSPGSGGGEAGPDPHDFYDSALGACKALTMLWYAQRNGIAVEDILVSITRDSSRERQGTYALTARVAVTGALSEAERAKLIDVATKCPVHRLMTEVTTEIATIGMTGT